MALIPMTSLSGKQLAKVFNAILSAVSLKVGTKTQLFKARKMLQENLEKQNIIGYGTR